MIKPRALAALSASVVAYTFAAGDGALAQTKTRSISQNTAAHAAKQHPQIVEEFGGEEGGARGIYIRNVGAKVGARTKSPTAPTPFA